MGRTRANVDTLWRISEALGLHLSELIRRVEEGGPRTALRKPPPPRQSRRAIFHFPNTAKNCGGAFAFCAKAARCAIEAASASAQAPPLAFLFLKNSLQNRASRVMMQSKDAHIAHDETTGEYT